MLKCQVATDRCDILLYMHAWDASCIIQFVVVVDVILKFKDFPDMQQC